MIISVSREFEELRYSDHSLTNNSHTRHRLF